MYIYTIISKHFNFVYYLIRRKTKEGRANWKEEKAKKKKKKKV